MAMAMVTGYLGRKMRTANESRGAGGYTESGGSLDFCICLREVAEPHGISIS